MGISSPPLLNIDGAGAQLFVVGAGMLVMIVSAIWRQAGGRRSGYLALAGLVAALGWVVGDAGGVRPVFDGALAADGPSVGFSVVLIVAGMLSVLLGMDFLRREGLERDEYYVLLLLATAGGLAMAAASDLVVVFVGLEVLSISLYVLSGFDKARAESREAALKYLLLGAFASAFFLYGTALLYGTVGTTRLAEIGGKLQQAGAGPRPLLWGGIALVLVGVGFKLALVPFHTWAPDVYQGAPTPVTAFMSVISKTAAFAALVRLLAVALPGQLAFTSTVLAILSVLTMTVGNAMALLQDDIKRLLAYSSIAQAGYILVALVAGGELGPAAVLFYLLAYAFTNLGAFAVVLASQRGGGGQLVVGDLAGLGFRRPWLAAALTLFLLSLTGIPLTAGFVGKLYLFSAAVQANWVWLAVVAVLNSVVSAFYYLRLVMAMYMREGGVASEAERPGWALSLALGICVAGVLVLGLMPGPALDWARDAVRLVLT